jgi:hypothetical protein
MSDLENEIKPHIYAMMHNQRTTLVPAQQKALSRWAILKAMVLEAAARKRIPFYGESERTGIKPPSCLLPVRTAVWIARFAEKGFHAGGTDIWGAIDKIPKAMHGNVTTIVVGHLVLQVRTMHVPVQFSTFVLNVEGNAWNWDSSLLQIWPVFGRVSWPPALSFTTTMPNHLGRLVNRWKVGQDIA